MKIKFKFLITLIACLVLVGCSMGRDQLEEDESIKIGLILPLSGVASHFGRDIQQSALLAAEYLEGEGLLSRPLELIFEDDATDPKKTLTAFHWLRDSERVHGMVGGVWSFLYEALAPVSDSSRMILVSPNPRLPDYEIRDFVFQVSNPLEEWFGKFRELIVEKKWPKVAVVRYESKFSDVMYDQIKMGADTVGAEIVYDQGLPSMDEFPVAILLKLRGADPDVVFLDVTKTQLSELIRRANELEYDLPQLVTHTVARDAINEGLVDPDDLEGIFYLEAGLDPAFVQKYEETYDEKPIDTSYPIYNGVIALALALDESDLDSEQARELLENDIFLDRISFDEFHDLAEQEMLVKTINGGEMVLYNQD